MHHLALFVTFLSTSWTVLGALAVAKVTRSRLASVPEAQLPGVTVLKPLCGADPSLQANLESFFVQDHPRFEIVFGVERADDPAIRIARALIEKYPHVAARVVVHTPPAGHNPKVRNLRGIIRHATHDIVVISDSNVRAPRHYLSEAVATMARDPDVGIVTHLFAGEGGDSIGARLECVQLSGFIAAGVALPTTVGDAAVIGKSMFFRRSDLNGLGGLARVANVLAEDYVIGKLFQRAGRKIVLSPVVLTNVVGPLALGAFFERHLRWSMLRIRLRPAFFFVEWLTSPLAVLPFAYAAFGAWSLLWMLAMLALRDVVGPMLLGEVGGAYRALKWSLVREVVTLAVWATTPLKRHISWRGHRVRVGAGTVLVADG